jgi:hypothetical protein
MRLLMWSFLRRGWLRARAAGVAVGLSVLAIVSYTVIAGEIRPRAAQGEAIVDASLGELAVFKVGSLLTLRKGVTATLSVRVVGVLDPAAARAPRGVLVARSYCLGEAAGGRLARVWVRLRGGADPGGWPPSRCSCRQPRCSSSA